MSDIIPLKSINIEKELHNLQLYKNHPNGILNVSLDRLKDMLGGRVEIVDPNNPFTYLLETSCMNTAFAIQEMTFLTRKLYPRLANNEEDLYLHMSDVDYLGRFSLPAKKTVTFNILLNGFENNAFKEVETGDHLHTIPKNFKVTVDNYKFTLTTPIDIRITSTGILDVRYRIDETDDIFELSTNLINFETYSINQDETYITFEVDMHELDLEATEIPVEKSKLFKGKINFTLDRKFYHFKAYHLVKGKWKEMITTHTDQVYDIMTPTCIIKVNQTNNEIEYYIPPVYTNTSRLGTKVKFVTYTTLGKINVNFADYIVSDFKTEYNSIFPEVELSESTKALNTINKVVFIEGRIDDGRGPKSFSKLKASVIDNNLGKNHKPITNVQLSGFLDDKDLTLIRNVDNVTNRLFLLELDVPKNPSRYGVSKVNLGLMELANSVEQLRSRKNGVMVVNDEITILPEGTLFINDDDGLSLVDVDIYETLTGVSGVALANLVNTTNYLSLYYHYVLNTSNNRTTLKAYDISKPKIKGTNFKGFNSTSRIGVNTINTNLVKSKEGFQLDILSKIKKYDAQYGEDNITPYLTYRDSKGPIFYLEGRYYTSIEGQPVYRFNIESDYFIDENNRIHITNFKDKVGKRVNVNVDLSSEIDLIYLSNKLPPNFKASSMDNYIRSSYLSEGNLVVTLETIHFIFGYYLEHLYSRVHVSTGLEEFEVWEDDVKEVYDRNVYGPNNQILYRKNDPLLNEEEEEIIKFHKGDIKLDDNGDPVVVKLKDPVRYMNLLLVDYKSVLANDSDLTEYKESLRQFVTKKVIKDVKELQTKLLENTSAYMTVPSVLGKVQVKHDGLVSYIDASQSFDITLYVDRKTYENVDTRNGLQQIITNELQNYISTSKSLSKGVIVSRMLSKTGDFVKSISIDKFTEINSEYIELEGTNTGLSFRSSLVSSPDGYTLKEAVNFTFMLVE